MTFDEVETLFHEFGHGLQHMLTTVERPQAAGINNVEWDAVELPSQFMENWCYDRATLMGMARHWQSGEPLPEAEYAKLLAARTFMGGSATLRQVHFALTDLQAAQPVDPGLRPDPRRSCAGRSPRTTTVLEPIDEDAFLCSFSHIFAGGYVGRLLLLQVGRGAQRRCLQCLRGGGSGERRRRSVATGRRFRDTVLSLGGSRHPARGVRGLPRPRNPAAEALIRHSGLVGAKG